jgi:hypothetical protein
VVFNGGLDHVSALILAEFFVIIEADRVPPGVPKGMLTTKIQSWELVVKPLGRVTHMAWD